MPYPISNHYNGTHFYNPGSPQAKGLADVLRWKLTTRADTWVQDEAAWTPDVPPKSVSGNNCRITLVNHATVLIQSEGVNILTDPVWSERASPFSWIGPRRKSPPGIKFEDLPPINAVLLSHNHYDHLDLQTLRRIQAGHAARFIVPLGVEALLKKAGIEAEEELDWWDGFGPITCLPAQHFSARGLGDRNKTLWCSYWIETAAGAIYFGADSGFGPHFAEIREQLGQPRLALLPIGAYKPVWFMRAIHMSPVQAVEAHEILSPEQSVAIHWGTFQLADDGRSQPVQELEMAMKARPGLPPFDAIPNGSVIELS